MLALMSTKQSAAAVVTTMASAIAMAAVAATW